MTIAVACAHEVGPGRVGLRLQDRSRLAPVAPRPVAPPPVLPQEPSAVVLSADLGATGMHDIAVTD